MISRSHVFVVVVLRARVGAVCDDAVHAPAVLPHGAAVGRGCSHHIKEWAQYYYNAQAHKVRRRGIYLFFNGGYLCILVRAAVRYQINF